MTTANDINKALEDYSQRFWDDEHPDYDPDSEDHQFWSWLYYGDRFVYVPDGESYDEKMDSFDIPGLGTIKVVDRFDDYDDGHAIYVVFTVNDETETYMMSGWDSSWSGDGGWEGPVQRVTGHQVTKTEWKVV